MPSNPESLPEAGTLTYLEAISLALQEEMAKDESVFLMGQDIAEYGGAFKVTRDFVGEFGKDRLVNTPISESGTIGMAVGAALLGRRPIVEMQFADFVSCGFNQLVNVAAKMHWRTGAAVPLVVRLPVGAGAGAGPFHSQSMEAWFLHTPGLKVVAPSSPADAYILLRAAVRDPNPVLYLEHKSLYRRLKGSVEIEKGTDADALRCGVARVLRQGSDAVVLTYGRPVHAAVEAAEMLAADGVSIAVVDLCTLMPLDESTMLEWVQRTGRVLIVHEAGLTGGFGAELAARVADSAFAYLDAPIRRLAFPDHPVPFHKTLEDGCLPSTETIATALVDLVGW